MTHVADSMSRIGQILDRNAFGRVDNLIESVHMAVTMLGEIGDYTGQLAILSTYARPIAAEYGVAEAKGLLEQAELILRTYGCELRTLHDDTLTTVTVTPDGPARIERASADATDLRRLWTKEIENLRLYLAKMNDESFASQ